MFDPFVQDAEVGRRSLPTPRTPAPRKRKATSQQAAGGVADARQTDGAANKDKDGSKRSKTTSSKGPMPTREMEIELWKEGFTCIAGVDEAGRDTRMYANV
jgi:hypothetical protein